VTEDGSCFVMYINNKDTVERNVNDGIEGGESPIDTNIICINLVLFFFRPYCLVCNLLELEIAFVDIAHAESPVGAVVGVAYHHEAVEVRSPERFERPIERLHEALVVSEIVDSSVRTFK